MSEYIGGFISPSHVSLVGTSKVSLKKNAGYNILLNSPVTSEFVKIPEVNFIKTTNPLVYKVKAELVP